MTDVSTTCAEAIFRVIFTWLWWWISHRIWNFDSTISFSLKQQPRNLSWSPTLYNMTLPINNSKMFFVLKTVYIDYYMLRAGYRFYSRVFNTISRTSEFTSEWAVWYLKRVNKNDIRLLTCNNLFITYYTLKKNQATKFKYKKALTKLQSNSSRQSNFSRQIWRQASA